MRKLIAVALACIALPAAAQTSANLPVTCPTNGSGNCTVAISVVNPDGTPIAGSSASASNGVAPSANSAVSGSQIIKASAGNLYGLNVTSGASAGYVMLFNSATVPADGAVAPVKCVPLAANTGIEFNWRTTPLAFTTGIVAVFSTTGCYAKAISATAYISADAK